MSLGWINSLNFVPGQLKYSIFQHAPKSNPVRTDELLSLNHVQHGCIMPRENHANASDSTTWNILWNILNVPTLQPMHCSRCWVFIIFVICPMKNQEPLLNIEVSSHSTGLSWTLFCQKFWIQFSPFVLWTFGTIALVPSLWSAISSITEQCHLMVFSHVHVQVSEVRVHCSSELSKINAYPIHIAFSFIHVYSTNNPTWDLYCTTGDQKPRPVYPSNLYPYSCHVEKCWSS